MSKCKKALDMACKTPLFSNPVSMAFCPTCPKRKLAINWRAGSFVVKDPAHFYQLVCICTFGEYIGYKTIFRR